MTGSDSFIIGTNYDPVDDSTDTGMLEVVTAELGVFTMPISGTGIWSGKRLTVTQGRYLGSFLNGPSPRAIANSICQSDPWAGNGNVSVTWEALLKRGGNWINPSAIRAGVSYVTGQGHSTPDTALFDASSDNDTTKPIPVPLGDIARQWVWTGHNPTWDCQLWQNGTSLRDGSIGLGTSVGWPIGDRTQWFTRTSGPVALSCNSSFPIYCVEQ
jgi:hypothetical protein